MTRERAGKRNKNEGWYIWFQNAATCADWENANRKHAGKESQKTVSTDIAQDEQRLWLDDVVTRLCGQPVWKCNDLQYWNHPELPEQARVQGYYVCYQTADRAGYPLYVMISRSQTNDLIHLEEVINDLRSAKVVFPFSTFGEYYAQRSKRRGPGTYATIRFGSRWYMLSVCGQLTPFHKFVMQGKAGHATIPMTWDEVLQLEAAKQPKLKT